MDSSLSFEPNAILRGFQLTIVGRWAFSCGVIRVFYQLLIYEIAVRALRNPELFKHEHFRQAAIAVAVGVAIHLIVQIPIIALKFTLYLISFLINLHDANWDDKLLNGVGFLSKSVLQVPFLLMTLMGHLTPTLDEIFMQSIHWVDTTYIQKHKSDNPDDLRAMYYPTLVQFPTKGGPRNPRPKSEVVMIFVNRYGKKLALGLGIYFLSMSPIFGRFVMPAASFYTFKKHVGTTPAAVIFGAGLILPKSLIIRFLHTYYASRTLMRELLDPYFRRIKFTPDQKRRWFHDREGVLFGFAFAFTMALKTPFIGVLMYGIAEASTAYLVTKITDPPPSPVESEGFAESQIIWKNKHDFLRLSLDKLDEVNVGSGHLTPSNNGRSTSKKLS